MATLISNDIISLTGIDGTDCLGDSRAVINGNITTVGESLSSLYTRTSTISSTVTTLNASVTANQTNVTSVSTQVVNLSTDFTALQTSFNTNNAGPLDTLTLGTLVSSLSVFNSSGDYIGYLPIYQ